jgi:hypothetical protein
MSKILFLFSGMYFFSSICMAQIHIGGQFSTFHIPAVPLRTNGFGITTTYVANDVNGYSVSLNYFTHSNPTDSIGELPSGGGNTIYTKFKDKFSFLVLSLNFYRYLLGDASADHRFAFYAGAGAGIAHVVQKTSFQYTNSDTIYKTTQITPCFEFLLGGEANLDVVKFFVRGKMSLYLKHLIPINDNSAIPMVTNTQIGFLIPLKRYKN